MWSILLRSVFSSSTLSTPGLMIPTVTAQSLLTPNLRFPPQTQHQQSSYKQAQSTEELFSSHTFIYTRTGHHHD
ncbi:hypothetical protein VUR80DRAFT_8717 [Thermomyces stellatus]